MIDLDEVLPVRSTTRTLKRVIPYLKQHNIKTVLDYGAGTLRNTNYLLRNGFEVIIVEKREQLEKMTEMPEMRFINKALTEDEVEIANIKVDAIISNFVLSLLSIKEQNKMLSYMWNVINKDGYLLIETKKWNNINLHIYEREQQSYLDNLIVPFGFDRIVSFRNVYSLASLYKKTNYNWN